MAVRELKRRPLEGRSEGVSTTIKFVSNTRSWHENVTPNARAILHSAGVPGWHPNLANNGRVGCAPYQHPNIAKTARDVSAGLVSSRSVLDTDLKIIFVRLGVLARRGGEKKRRTIFTMMDREMIQARRKWRYAAELYMQIHIWEPTAELAPWFDIDGAIPTLEFRIDCCVVQVH